MRRFILTYTREGQSIDIEGVQFSSGAVLLELYPDDEWPGSRAFRDFARMEYVINEFAETSIAWIDEEEPQSEEDAPHAQFINLLGSGGILQ